MGQIVHVTSRDNARVKEARQIRDGKQREKIFVEGLRLVEEAVRSGIEIEILFVSEDAAELASALIDAAQSGEVYQLSDTAFRSIADTVTSQGILAIAKRPSETKHVIEQRLEAAAVPL